MRAEAMRAVFSFIVGLCLAGTLAIWLGGCSAPNPPPPSVSTTPVTIQTAQIEAQVRADNAAIRSQIALQGAWMDCRDYHQQLRGCAEVNREVAALKAAEDAAARAIVQREVDAVVQK